METMAVRCKEILQRYSVLVGLRVWGPLPRCCAWNILEYMCHVDTHVCLDSTAAELTASSKTTPT